MKPTMGVSEEERVNRRKATGPKEFGAVAAKYSRIAAIAGVSLLLSCGGGNQPTSSNPDGGNNAGDGGVANDAGLYIPSECSQPGSTKVMTFHLNDSHDIFQNGTDSLRMVFMALDYDNNSLDKTYGQMEAIFSLGGGNTSVQLLVGYPAEPNGIPVALCGTTKIRCPQIDANCTATVFTPLGWDNK